MATTTGFKSAIKDDGTRKQAKEAFEAHTKATGNMDLLDRCKKLNDFLASVSYSAIKELSIVEGQVVNVAS